MGGSECGTPSVTCIGCYGKCADNQHLPVGLEHIEVHPAVVVGKDPEVTDLISDIGDVVLAVADLNSKVDQESVINRAGQVTFDVEEIGRAAVRELTRQMEMPFSKARRTVIPPRLVRGSTCAQGR